MLSLVTDFDSSAAVKRALLHDLTRLAVFMSRQETNDVLLPHFITFLNDREASLRIAFFESIAGVCAFVGRVSLQAFVLPCILQGGLYDVDEAVVAAALRSLCRLGDVSLHTRSSLLEIATKIGPLLCHPNSWVRHAAIEFFASIGPQFSPIETFALLRPAIKPFLQWPLASLDVEHLQAALRPPASRLSFDLALACAAEQQQQHAAMLSMTSPPTGGSRPDGGAPASPSAAAASEVQAFDSSEDVAALKTLLEGDEAEANADDEAAELPAPTAPPGSSPAPPPPRPPSEGGGVTPTVGGRGGAAVAATPSTTDTVTAATASAAGGAGAGGGRGGPVALSDMALDLRSISSLEPEEAAVLQAMREYIRAASIAKMAKIRLWETENLALLNTAGGGGGTELLQFRTLSQHVKPHKLGPPPPAATAAAAGVGCAAPAGAAAAASSPALQAPPSAGSAAPGGFRGRGA